MNLVVKYKHDEFSRLAPFWGCFLPLHIFIIFIALQYDNPFIVNEEGVTWLVHFVRAKSQMIQKNAPFSIKEVDVNNSCLLENFFIQFLCVNSFFFFKLCFLHLAVAVLLLSGHTFYVFDFFVFVTYYICSQLVLCRKLCLSYERDHCYAGKH